MSGFRLIDIEWKSIIKESFLIMVMSKGGFTFDQLMDMPFDVYEQCVSEAIRIQKLDGEHNG